MEISVHLFIKKVEKKHFFHLNTVKTD